MIPILKKEFNLFFASPIAYLVIGVFLLVNGLFLWVFKDDTNILNAGFADLNSFFLLAPWILLFLIPAITMKSFADELNAGTIETLRNYRLANCNRKIYRFAPINCSCFSANIDLCVYNYSVRKSSRKYRFREHNWFVHWFIIFSGNLYFCWFIYLNIF